MHGDIGSCGCRRDLVVRLFWAPFCAGYDLVLWGDHCGQISFYADMLAPAAFGFRVWFGPVSPDSFREDIREKSPSRIRGRLLHGSVPAREVHSYGPCQVRTNETPFPASFPVFD